MGIGWALSSGVSQEPATGDTITLPYFCWSMVAGTSVPSMSQDPRKAALLAPTVVTPLSVALVRERSK